MKKYIYSISLMLCLMFLSCVNVFEISKVQLASDIRQIRPNIKIKIDTCTFLQSFGACKGRGAYTIEDNGTFWGRSKMWSQAFSLDEREIDTNFTSIPSLLQKNNNSINKLEKVPLKIESDGNYFHFTKDNMEIYYKYGYGLPTTAYPLEIYQSVSYLNVISFLEKELNAKKSEQDPIKDGEEYILLRTISATKHSHFTPGLVVLSAASVFVLNLLGMPANSFTCEIKLEAKVFDKYHNEIYNIKRTGFGRAYAAVYYGYWNSEALTEASEVLAVKDGIEQIFTTIKTLKSNTNLLDFITY